jgi:hypothetical protein
MALRANKFLKFFAIALFLLEFLAPALPLEANTPTAGFSKTFQVNSSNHAGFFVTLFAEQLNENEEGRENYKSISPFIDSHFGFSDSYHAYILRAGSCHIENNTHFFHSQSLFRLHCIYLI